MFVLIIFHFTWRALAQARDMHEQGLLISTAALPVAYGEAKCLH